MSNLYQNSILSKFQVQRWLIKLKDKSAVDIIDDKNQGNTAVNGSSYTFSMTIFKIFCEITHSEKSNW